MRRVGAVVVAIALTAATGCRPDDDQASTSPSPTTPADGVTVDGDAGDRPVVTTDVSEPPGATTTSGGSSVTATTTTTTTTTTTVRPTTEDGVALPAGDDADVLGPLGSTEIELATDDGTVQIGSGGIPEAVPDDFPLPVGLVVQLSSDAGDVAGFSGVTRLSFDELVELYRTELPTAGYDVSEDRFIADTVAVIGFVGPDGSGQVAISSAPGGGRSVLVTFER